MLLSVVVPVHRVQGYLRQCLDSILDQSFTDFEVVAVDDRSPDHCAAILAEYAARDARVRVLSLPENAGLGRARNAGLAAAAGTYVWFLDSDDWLAAGALAAVADGIRATDPDVLLVGFDRVHWHGTVTTSPPPALTPPSAGGGTATLESAPELIEVLHVAWNKVVRRELLVRLGYQFEQGWYEDVSFTYPVLAAAQRIGTVPVTCVHYRQRRTGAITRTVDDRHFDVFEHWDRAFELVEKYAERPAALRPLLARRMVWHLVGVLRNGERLPRRSRRRFFRRMTEAYRRHVLPGGCPGLDAVERVRHAMLARGSYAGMAAVNAAAGAVRAVREAVVAAGVAARPAVRRIRDAALLVYYRTELLRPVDPRLALFAAYWYRGVSCNPAAIAAKTRELCPTVRTLWVVDRRRVAALPAGTDYVVANTPGYYRALARARWLINNVNWPDPVVKRRGSTHVMTHHGTPLKMMGLDQLDHPVAGGRDGVPAQLRRADRWDVSVTANAHTTIAWDRAYPCRYTTLEVGYPRNDRLVTAGPGEIAAARARVGLAEGARVVLYLPTHREWLPPGQPVLDVAELARRLGPDTTLLVRAHYFAVPAGAVPAPSRVGAVVDVSAYPVVEDLYLAADALITDYSSAMFDYAVLDRPIVIYAPDWPTYRELRGVYFDLLAQPPGAVATTEAGLHEIFAGGAWSGPAAAAARGAFRGRFCYLDDGGAAERVVRRVIRGDPA